LISAQFQARIPLVNQPVEALKALGAALRELRESQGMSLKSVAANSALEPDRLEALEDGRAEASLLELARLAEALNSSAASLMERAGL
jgi:transcriptional regulator with XRE-family HTH domain